MACQSLMLPRLLRSQMKQQLCLVQEYQSFLAATEILLRRHPSGLATLLLETCRSRHTPDGICHLGQDTLLLATLSLSCVQAPRLPQ